MRPTQVRVGFEHTIRVPVQPSQHAEATNILHMLLATDLFRSLDVSAPAPCTVHCHPSTCP